jgi:hypothetical protein
MPLPLPLPLRFASCVRFLRQLTELAVPQF